MNARNLALDQPRAFSGAERRLTNRAVLLHSRLRVGALGRRDRNASPANCQHFGESATVLETIMYKFVYGAVAGLCLLLPLAAQAQAQDVPSYAAQQYSADQNIHGRIVSFDGGYNLSVRDERGYIDNIQLHGGTIINPTGLTLAPGMIVSVDGYNAGNYFSANQIDTPYEFDGGSPYYAGHPWNYYGPSVSLGFFFGNPGWWHGDYFGGNFRYVGGARVYEHVRINEVYGRGNGEFHGRDFVAPREHGGYYGQGEHVRPRDGGNHGDHPEHEHHDGDRHVH